MKDEKKEPITKGDVYRAADELSEKGEKITQKAIRQVIGGSYTTIGEFLKEWKGQKEEEHELSEVQIPTEIEERTAQLSKSLWKTAMIEAERKLSAEREALGKSQEHARLTVIEIQEALKDLEDEAIIAQDNLVKKDEEIKADKEIIRRLEDSIKTQSLKEKELETNLKNKQGVENKNELLTEKIDTEREKNSTLTDDKATLSIELERLKAKVETFESKLKIAQEELTEKTDLAGTIVAQNKALESKNKSLEITSNKLQASLDATQKEVEENKKNKEAIILLNKKIEEKSTETGTLQGELKEIREQNKILNEHLPDSGKH